MIGKGKISSQAKASATAETDLPAAAPEPAEPPEAEPEENLDPIPDTPEDLAPKPEPQDYGDDEIDVPYYVPIDASSMQGALQGLSQQLRAIWGIGKAVFATAVIARRFLAVM